MNPAPAAAGKSTKNAVSTNKRTFKKTDHDGPPELEA